MSKMRVSKNRKWPADCIWPEPIWEGVGGMQWEADDLMPDELEEDFANHVNLLKIMPCDPQDGKPDGKPGFASREASKYGSLPRALGSSDGMYDGKPGFASREASKRSGLLQTLGAFDGMRDGKPGFASREASKHCRADRDSGGFDGNVKPSA